MTTPRLTVRPRPELAEDSHGYLLRLARVNGLPDFKSLVEVIGWRKTSNPLNRSYEKDARFIDTLAKALDLSKTVLKKQFAVRGYSKNTVVFGRMIEDIRVRQPRVCIPCLVEQRTIQAYWSLLPYSHCILHNSTLLDCCPDCGQQFKWTRSLFTGCIYCKKAWNETEVEKSEPLPWQKQFESVRRSTNKSSSWLDYFTEHVLRAARPTDRMHTKINHVPTGLTKLHDLLSQAWSLKVPSISIELREWGPDGLVLPRRLKLRGSIRNHINFSGVAEFLKIRSSNVQPLVDAEVLKPLNSGRIVRDMIFDVEDVQLLESSVSLIEKPSLDQKILNQTHPLLKIFDVQYGEFLASALRNGKIMYRREGFSEIVVCPMDAVDILTKHLCDRLSNAEHIPQTHVLGLLNISSTVFKAMIRDRTLEVGHSMATSQSITTDSIKALISSNHPVAHARKEKIFSLLNT